MKDNILKTRDDILIVDVTPKITGRVQLSGYTDVWEGITDTRTVRKEFRISADGIFWSDWRELNVENLSNGQFVANGQFVIQLRFTRTGTDETGEIEFKSISFQGSRQEIQFVAPTISNSIFADIIGTDELRELEENLFKKLYYRGILPDYITRAENEDEKEDADFIDVFYSVARFFAIMIRFFSRFENFRNDFDLMLENVRQYGLYFDESNISLDDLQYLSQHLLDEIRKRGTAMIFKRKGDIVNGQELPIDGEFIRLVRSKASDELLYENVPLYKVGWCLGQCSPMYRGTAQAVHLNKTKENTQDFENLDNFFISGSGYSLLSFDNKKVLRLNGSSSNGMGLGRVGTEEVDIDDLIVVDSRMDYEITFAFYISGGRNSSNKLLFGVEGFDILGNKMNDAFITPNGDQISDFFFQQGLTTWKSGNWYYARGIIHAYSSSNMDESKTNWGIGTNLYFNNSFVKYILPKIQMTGSGFDVRIWDYKVRPLVRGTNILPLKSGEENSHSLGFIQSQRLFYSYVRNNNNSQSTDEITDIIEKYLLPYNTTDIFVFMSNY